MPKPSRLNLNDWERVNTIEELESFQGLIFTPPKINNMQPDDLYYRKTSKNPPAIETPTGATWHKNVIISTKGSNYDYGRLLDWWLKSALDDPEFKQIVNSTYALNNFDIMKSLHKNISYLKGLPVSSRKSHLYKFIWTALGRDYNFYNNRANPKRY